MAPRNRRNFATPPPTGCTTTDNPPLPGGLEMESRVMIRGNPYQFKGPVEGFSAKAVVGEGLYLTVDMPGVADGGAEVWMEGKELFFQGEAHKEAEFEADRVYGGCIDLSSDPEEISEMKFDTKNGVLRIVLVGCSIQPDLSDLAASSSSTHSYNGIPNEICRAGNYLIGFRSFSAIEPIDGSMGIYPFQLSGPSVCCEIKVLDCDHMFMRIDMPDVPSKGKTVKFRDDVVFFGGEGKRCSKHDEECRGYFGRQRLQCGCCKYVGVQSEIKYGVLRMLIGKRKIKGRKSLYNCRSKN